jgi:predicted O-methyltransferase YrrM
MNLQKPSRETLDAILMRQVSDLVLSQSQDKQYIQMPAGKEHYRLLAYLGMHFKNILELGTYRGHSALALAIGAKLNGGSVLSCDIEDHSDVLNYQHLPLVFQLYPEGHRYASGYNDGLIFLDTYHDGRYERVVLNYLREIKWKGVLVMDDIFLNREMREVWSEITERKEDWTDIGHWSGTGIVFFD